MLNKKWGARMEKMGLIAYFNALFFSRMVCGHDGVL